MYKLNNMSSIMLKSQTRSQFWEPWMKLWTSIGLGELLERISQLQ